MINPLKEQFAQFSFKPVRESTEIMVANLGNDAGVIGTAWLVSMHIYELNKWTGFAKILQAFSMICQSSFLFFFICILYEEGEDGGFL